MIFMKSCIYLAGVNISALLQKEAWSFSRRENTPRSVFSLTTQLLKKIIELGVS